MSSPGRFSLKETTSKKRKRFVFRVIFFTGVLAPTAIPSVLHDPYPVPVEYSHNVKARLKIDDGADTEKRKHP